MDDETAVCSSNVCLKPCELFRSKKYVKMAAPMVRYSKLAFRNLVRKYDCDLAFTPMIISNCFVRSQKARDIEFTTNSADRPLVVQFAASNAKDFADAVELVAPYSDGADLNCGCPQRWAMSDGYGACLINKPDLISDMVTQARARVSDPEFSISIKIRLHDDISRTVVLCQQAERAGISWVTVHGRTAKQRAQPVDLEAVRLIKDSVQIPVVANGDVRSLADAEHTHAGTGCDGVMAARGLLGNPALYAGYDATPLQCITDWLDLSLSVGTRYSVFHHHLIDMLEHTLPRPERRIFNALQSTSSVLTYLDNYFGPL